MSLLDKFGCTAQRFSKRVWICTGKMPHLKLQTVLICKLWILLLFRKLSSIQLSTHSICIEILIASMISFSLFSFFLFWSTNKISFTLFLLCYCKYFFISESIFSSQTYTFLFCQYRNHQFGHVLTVGNILLNSLINYQRQSLNFLRGFQLSYFDQISYWFIWYFYCHY